MRAEIITLGFGFSGSAFDPASTSVLADDLGEAGFELGSVTFVSDQDPEIEEAFALAYERSRLIIIVPDRQGAPFPSSGREEMAKKALSRLLDRRLVLNEDARKRTESLYRSKGMEPPPGYEKSALIPQGARVLEDESSGHAGFILDHSSRVFVYLCAPSGEFLKSFVAQLGAFFKGAMRPRKYEKNRVVRTCGMDESCVAQALRGIGGSEAFITLSASMEGVDVRVKTRSDTPAKSDTLIDETVKEVLSRLGGYVYGFGSEGIESAVARYLTGRGLTIATAESCTGGLIAKRLTDLAGSSAYMERGVVTYSDRSKEELLHVPASVLIAHGAVSKETAQAMAEGIRWGAKVDIGVSVTGIAGPTGGTATKPVGLVYIGLATPDGVTVKGFNFPGERAAVRFAASQKALDMVRRYLIS